MGRFDSILRSCAVLLVVAPLALAQDGPRGLEQARERWERMTPAERERIQQRFEQFRELPQHERERVEAHLKRIEQARREIEARIPAELRAKLDTLEPEARRQVLREYVEAAMGERAERLRGKMSPQLLSQLESATPAEREKLLCARRDQLREHAPQALSYLAKKQGLPPEEVERLKALPADQQLAAVEQLGRREIERRGPPPGVSPEEFQRWLSLPPHELMERMQRNGGCGFRGRGDHSGPPDGRKGPPGEPGAREGGWPPRRDGEGRPEGNRGPRREGKISSEARAQAYAALRPESQWFLELADRPREERREEISRRVRAKVSEVLRAQPKLSEEEVARLESLPGKDYFDALRELAGDPPYNFRSGPRGAPPPGTDHTRRDRPRDDPPPRKDP